jgi:hypothetical protein
MTKTEAAYLRRLRRKAARHGWRVHKVPDRAQLRREYGPYMLAHLEAGRVGARGLQLDEVDAFLEAEAMRGRARTEV